MKLTVPSLLEYSTSGIEFQPMRTPSIDCEEVSEDQVHIRALSLSSRLIEECVKGPSFTCTDSVTRNFIAIRVFSMVYKTFTDSLSKALIKQVVSRASERKALCSIFRTVCRQAVSTKEKNAREV